MKTSSLFTCFTCITLMALLVVSCAKSSTHPASFPLSGVWVLKYSDDGSGNNHRDYPQDNSTPSFGSAVSWASHLSLLENDSAYWNSCGLDQEPIWFSKGTYSLSADDNNHPTISLSFTINNYSAYNYSTFEYAFKDTDTLVLNADSSTPTFYTYVKK